LKRVDVAVKIKGLLLINSRIGDDDGAEKRHGVNMGVVRLGVVDKKRNSMLVKE